MSLPRLSLVVLLLLITSVVTSAASASVEIPLAPPRLGPSSTPRFRFGTSVASSGHGYLVAWEEREMEAWPPGMIMIRAFDETGRPLQTVATALGGGVAPSIAWNGREYLVVFGELGSRFGSVAPVEVAEMTRIAEDGTRIDQTPIVVTKQLSSYTRSTSVAWNGAEYLVCWSGNASGAAIVTSDLQTRVLDVTAAGGPVSVASNGGGFLIAGISWPPWELRLLPVSAAGDMGVVRVVGTSESASLAAVDGDYELLWSSPVGGLQAARVTSDLHPVTLTTAQTAFGRVAAANGAVVASWMEYPHSPASYTTRVCTQRLDITSQPVCSEENNSLQHDPAIGVALNTFFLAWSDGSSGIDDTRIDVTSKWIVPVASDDGRIISEAAAAQGPPAIERRVDGGIVAVWSESNPLTRHDEIRIGGLDASGARLPDHAVAPDGSDQNNPRISLGGDRALILWRDETLGTTPWTWLATVVGTAGIFSSPPIVIAGNDFDESVAFDGNEWLVVSGGIRYTIIDLAGRVVQTGLIDQPSYAMQVGTVTGVNGGFVIAWSELGGPGGQDSRVLTSRIAISGTSGWQASAPSLVDDGASSWSLSAPAIAANANRVLVTWVADSKGSGGREVRQAILDDHGDRLGANVAMPWHHSAYRSRSRPAPGGFATLVSTGIVLTSLDGRIRGVVDLSMTYISDFLVDADDRFTIAYDRSVTVDETLGYTFRAFLRHVEPTRGRAVRMR